MTITDEYVESEFATQAEKLSVEFERDSRRYISVLTLGEEDD